MSAASAILGELQERGVTVRADGDHLVLKPRRVVDAGLLARVREHKNEIVEVLTRSSVLPIPNGVRLIRYERKAPPVMVESYAIVTDLQKFIEIELQELDARLHAPTQIRGGFGILTILDWLAQCGVELEIVSPLKQGLLNQ